MTATAAWASNDLMKTRIGLLALLLAACSSSDAPVVDASPSPDLRVAPDMTLTGCHGVFEPTGGAKFLWQYTTCTVSANATPNDVTLQITPVGNMGTPPTKVFLFLSAAPAFKVGHYDLTNLEPGVGTLLQILAMDQAANYTATRPDDGTPSTGSISLDLWSLPTATSGPDTTAHGYLSATLDHDPTTAGSGTLVLQSYF